MPEFRKIVQVPPIILHVEDVRVLVELLLEGVPRRPRAIEFALASGDRTYQAETIDELLNQKLPNAVDSITIRVLGWTDDNSIDRGVTMDLRPTVSDYQIHSLDEVWFKGKIQQIDEFFRARRAWYGWFREAVPFVTGLLEAGLIGAVAFFLIIRSYIFAAVPVVMLIVINRAFYAALKGKLFPKTRIILGDATQKLNYEGLTLLFTVLSFLLGVIVFVLQLIKP
jgi:hypothetical protein